jgi:hypothetical protein
VKYATTLTPSQNKKTTTLGISKGFIGSLLMNSVWFSIP